MNQLKKMHILPYSMLLLITIILSFPLFNPNLDIYRDDGIQHITRLMGTVQTIMEGQFPPMVMSNFYNGFGYSWNLFYSPISAYLPCLFILIGCSFIGSIKGFLFLMVFLSGVSMYHFTKKVTNHTGMAMLAAILYMTMPYHINDIYNRVAIAEVASFVCLPMVFHGMYKVLHKETIAVLVIGAVGMLLSHTVLTLYTAIMAGIYLLVSFKKLEKSVIKKIVISAGCILLLTSFYWEPMLESKLATQYEVFKPGRMSHLVEIQQQDNHLVDIIQPIDLLVDYHNKMGSYSINLICIIGLLSTVLCIRKVRTLPYASLYWTFLGLGLASLIMSLSIFPFEKLPELFKMLQFRFRMLEFVDVFFSFIAAVNLHLVIKNVGRKETIAISMMVLIVALPVIHRWSKNQEEIPAETVYWPAVAVTQNTGRVHAGCASFEYLPSKAFENRTYIVERSNEPEIIEGSAEIQNFQKQQSKATMHIQTKEGTTVEFPYIYYIGYQITLESENGKQTLKPTESEKGFLQVQIPQTNEATLSIDYTGTTNMKIAYVTSLCTMLGLGVWSVVRKKRKTNDKGV